METGVFSLRSRPPPPRGRPPRGQPVRTRAAAVLLLAVALGACTRVGAEEAPPPAAPSGPVPPPVAGPGVSAEDLPSDLEGWTQQGVASWYGEPFHGRTTASGERYDMYAATAAHRVLPFGARVRIHNLDNGRQTVLRINDRGPFVDGRIIDVSLAGARELGLVGPGTARVIVEVVEAP